MEKKSMQFLEQMMNAPSPSGFEDKVRKIWYNRVKAFSQEINVDVHGNIISAINSDKKPRIMLAGHIDELGFQVKYISDKGFIYFSTLGGFEYSIIPGRKVRIHTAGGDILGVVGKKAIHLRDRDANEKPLKIHDLYIDIGAKDGNEVKKLIEIGDPITYDPNFEKMQNDRYVSRAFDDKIGAFIVAEVMKNIFKRKNELKAGIFGVATVQEEVGLRGARTAAYGIDPQIGIAIDVTHGTDTPDTDAKKDGDIQLGKGLAIAKGTNVNPRIFKQLQKVASKHNVPYQIEAEPYPTGTDANVIQITKSGVAAALLSIPLRYMHTFTEVISIKDVKNAITLLTEFCLSVDKNINLIP